MHSLLTPPPVCPASLIRRQEGFFEEVTSPVAHTKGTASHCNDQDEASIANTQPHARPNQPTTGGQHNGTAMRNSGFFASASQRSHLEQAAAQLRHSSSGGRCDLDWFGGILGRDMRKTVSPNASYQEHLNFYSDRRIAMLLSDRRQFNPDLVSYNYDETGRSVQSTSPQAGGPSVEQSPSEFSKRQLYGRRTQEMDKDSWRLVETDLETDF